MSTLSKAALLVLASACGAPAPRASIHDASVLVQPEFRAPLVLLDAATGKVAGRVPADGWADAPPGAGGLFFVHGDGGLSARDAKTGSPRWRVLTKASYFRAPVVTDKLVFVFGPSGTPRQASGHAWRGYDTTTGAKRFDVPCDAGAPLGAGGGVLVTFEDGRLTVRELDDGKERYQVKDEAEPPVLVAGERFFARVGGGLGVFRTETGRLERTLDLGDTDALDVRGGVTPRLAATTEVVISLADETVTATDAGSGKKRWSAPTPNGELLAVSGGVCVVAGSGGVIGLDAASGSKKWSAALEDGPSGLVASSGVALVRAADTLVVIDLASGKRRFAHTW